MMDRLYFETKIAADDAGAVSGIAWQYDKPDRIGDMIAPGAFKGAKRPLPMLFGHDANDPVGTWDSLTETADGLRVAGKLLIDDVERAREVHALVRAGAVRGLSIMGIVKKVTARSGGRLISALELLEVSLVAIPMHPGARVTSAKSALAAINIAEAIHRATAALRTGN